MRITLLLLTTLFCCTAVADIYKWVDADGQVHYSDNPDQAPADAETADPGPVNTVPAPAPASPQMRSDNPQERAAAQPKMTPSRWAEQNCSVRVRILYTDGRFVPCIPTDEVPVYVCTAEAPRQYSRFFGRSYRYEDRESQCGPEVYEGEVLYLKKP